MLFHSITAIVGLVTSFCQMSSCMREQRALAPSGGLLFVTQVLIFAVYVFCLFVFSYHFLFLKIFKFPQGVQCELCRDIRWVISGVAVLL